MSKRFVLIEGNPDFQKGNFAGREFGWFWDTERPLDDGSSQPYVARQCYLDKDPNDLIRCNEMALLFTDQAEYYAVCLNCYYKYSHLQWSGSTHAHDWRTESVEYLEEHKDKKGWCEFCDPVFGNGGWSL